MLQKIIKSFFAIIIFCIAQPQQVLLCSASSQRFIYLSFDGVENPPDCIIPHKCLKRPKVGLALSGGGTRGFAQVAVLQVLEENNIPIDLIVGTSIGSIIGGLYASGYEPDQIWQIVNSIQWQEILSDTPPRSTQFLGEKQERDRHILQLRLSNFGVDIPKALTSGHHLTRILTDLTMKAPYRSTDFNKLYVPLQIIATDLLSGTKVNITNGELAEAMHASIAIPLLFTPVQRDSMLLVDGGILDNIPVEETLRAGADIVIAVDTTSPLRTKSQMSAPWEVADQVTTIMQKSHNKQQRSISNILIDLSEFNCSSTEIDKIPELFEYGKKLTKEKISDIKNAIEAEQDITQINKIFDSVKIKIKGTKNHLVYDRVKNLPVVNLTENEIIKTAKSIYQIGSFSDVIIHICEKNNLTLIEFSVTENPILNNVHFSGNTIFPDSLLRTLFVEILGQPINHKKSSQCLHGIQQLYHSQGYSLMQIVTISFDRKSQTAQIRVDEGKIGNINFKGLKRTREFVVRREFSLKSGNVFNYSKLKQGIDNIYGTDLFNSILWSNTKKGDSWQITIRLEEKMFSLMRFGGRYDLERRGRVFLELADENVFGTGNVSLLHAQYGTRDIKAEGLFRADRIFHSYFTSKAKVYYVQNKHYTYSYGKRRGEYIKHSSGFTLSLGQQIERFGTVSISSRIEKIQLQKIDGIGYPTGSLNLRTLGLSSVVDTRDRLPFPQKGKHHHFSYEVSSGRLLISNISYFKVFNRLESYYTFFGQHTIKPILYWGMSDQTTPFSEQFRLGGLDSFFGLRDEELIGRHLFLASLEYRFKIERLLPFETYLRLRYDIGNVWLNNVDVKIGDVLHGFGCTLSFNTFLGPFSIAYGQSDDKRSNFYFSSGFNF